MSDSFDRSVDVTGQPRADDAHRRFEATCLPFRADLVRFVYWLCQDRALAEDVIQETLLRAWKSIGTLEDPRAARAWLLTIARRELARVFERKSLPTVDIDTAIAAGDGALAVTESHEVEDVRRAIFALDVLYREPLMMQVLLGLTTEEIARQLEIGTSAVLTRLFRARRLLRKQLTGTTDHEDGYE